MSGPASARPIAAKISKGGCPAQIAAALVLAAMSCWLFHLQVTTPLWGNFRSDLRQHLRVARQVWDGQVYISHPGFHITTLLFSHASGWTPESSAVLVLTLAIVASYWITLRILKFYLSEQCGGTTLAILALALSLVSSIYAPFFSRSIYLGQGTPNIWHSPTWIAAEPFALLGFFLAERQLQACDWTLSRRRGWMLSLVLALGAIYKPSFAVAFLPAVGLFLCWDFIRRKASGQSLILFGAILIPTLIVLLMQYLVRYGQPMEIADKRIIWAPLQVWSRKTPSVVFSVVLALALPLSVLATNPRELSRFPGFRLAWFLVVIAFLQRALLAESGNWMMDGNWAWGYFSALKIVFIYSVVAMFLPKRPVGARWAFSLWLPLVFLTLHLGSGIVYYWRLISGVGYY